MQHQAEGVKNIVRSYSPSTVYKHFKKAIILIFSAKPDLSSPRQFHDKAKWRWRRHIKHHAYLLKGGREAGRADVTVLNHSRLSTCPITMQTQSSNSIPLICCPLPIVMELCGWPGNRFHVRPHSTLKEERRKWRHFCYRTMQATWPRGNNCVWILRLTQECKAAFGLCRTIPTPTFWWCSS